MSKGYTLQRKDSCSRRRYTTKRLDKYPLNIKVHTSLPRHNPFLCTLFFYFRLGKQNFKTDGWCKTT